VAENNSVTIIQITDSHLRKEPDGVLLGMNTRDSLDAVLDLVKAHCHQPDLVLATGDIAQDGSAGAYQCFDQKISAFSCPVIYFSGNHDDPAVMSATINRPESFEKVWHSEYWKLIFLDSSVRSKVSGALAAEEIDLLRQTLATDKAKHTGICFHHHPVPVGSAWLDTIGLLNSAELFSVLDQFEQTRMLLWGHIHQEFDQYRNGVRLLATPSTCVQFKPESEEFAVDSLSPGYRWLTLMADGTINTGVERVEHIEFAIDLSSKGY